MTEPGGKSWRQTIFYPFMHASLYGRGTVLRCPVVCGKYDSAEFQGVPWLETVAVHNDETDALTIFAVNRNLSEPLELEARLLGYEGYVLKEHISLSNTDLMAVNSAAGETVAPKTQSGGVLDCTSLLTRLAPASWNVLRLEKKK
jgi:alpha-N-arabinofuranosidase